MTDIQRHELYVKLMCAGPALEHPEDYKELAQMTVDDVERIEPVIDEMLKLAFDQGKMEALLETWAKHQARWRALIPGVL